MDEQLWKGNVNDNENTNSWPNETRPRHRNWSAAALGPGPTNLHQPLELSARSSADSTVAALASSLGNGDFKPSEGGFGGITELWINERGQGAATTAAQAGAERSLLCGAHCSILVVGKGGQGSNAGMRSADEPPALGPQPGT
ncbi:hypothetical protein FPCIR_12184 [Fusarium pseudocircinatum]|uniref:Uncharacterized protein n=1 Tax=Fusarium pseudocircinatum TaxID=56676 RepID=A0A8H5NT83_9HYPO|nr:hypothetical protein FPCIR_12184 [Fusarium pseudocircinatum]